MKICSFSLWGANSDYWRGAVQNIRKHKSLNSGYEVFIFIDKYSREIAEADGDLGKYLAEIIATSNLITLTRKAGSFGMFWRMIPLLWADVERVVVRDCDSVLTERELYAVKEWENSKKSFHIMRDHPAHTSVIMGGMFGCVNKDISKAFMPLRKLLDADRIAPIKTAWQVDQVFLKRYIYPLIKDVSVVHDPFYSKLDFPSSRKGSTYVGEAVTRKSEFKEEDDLVAIEEYLATRQISQIPARVDIIKKYIKNQELFCYGQSLIDDRYVQKFEVTGAIDLLDKGHSDHKDFA